MCAGVHRSRGPRAPTRSQPDTSARHGDMERRVQALQWYLTAVSVVGLSLLALAIATVDATDVSHRLLLVVVAGLLLIAGEMKPIPVSRGADAGDELSISSTMAMALLLLLAPGVACATQ